MVLPEGLVTPGLFLYFTIAIMLPFRFQEFCKSYGSYMVHVNTEKENNFIVSTLKQLDRGEHLTLSSTPRLYNGLGFTVYLESVHCQLQGQQDENEKLLAGQRTLATRPYFSTSRLTWFSIGDKSFL